MLLKLLLLLPSPIAISLIIMMYGNGNGNGKANFVCFILFCFVLVHGCMKLGIAIW